MAALATLAGACGAVAPVSAPAGSSPTPSIVVTDANSGGTVSLAVGQEAALRLPTRYSWSDPQVSGGAVRLAPTNAANAAGYREWTVTAVARGSATITSGARPLCSPGAICPGAILAFSVTVVVS